ncbi:hypothetical protein [Streptomyces sp. NPDC057199]|uniref:hypothetical protein n=1 Tax=Streptomyces sp. NPDC057199 TaxID=3346047 RepID=UPI00363FCAF0
MVHLIRIPDTPRWGRDSHASKEDLYTYSPEGRLVSIVHPLALAAPPGRWRCRSGSVPVHLAEAMSAVIRARQCESKGLSTPTVLDTAAEGLGVRRGPQWREALSTVLASDWTAPLRQSEALDVADVLHRLASDVRLTHRQLTPLWRRKVLGARVRLLDTPVTADLTLYDVVAATPSLPDTTAEVEDARIAAVLSALRPAERNVALAWGDPAVTTWAEAAWCAGAPDPEAFGERVRRKVRRIVAEQQRRAGQRQPSPDRRPLTGPAREWA